MTKECLLINYRTKNKGECSSRLTSQYCCKRIVRELDKKPFVRKIRQSIGGISRIKPDGWLKKCPYCNAKIKMRKILIDKIPYDFIVQAEIRGAFNK